MKIVMDMETRSKVDLLKTGVHVYAADPSTDILCISVKVDAEKPFLWKFNTCSEELRGIVEQADEIHAHNVQFERIMWTEILVKRAGFPEIPFHKWRDTAAKAAMYALPRDLARACQALGLPIKKDMEGRRLMLKMCKPRRARKDEDPDQTYWHESYDDLKRLGQYCIQDVEAEYALDQALIDMPESEIKIWQLDQKINDRGIYADVGDIENIVEKVNHFNKEALTEIEDLTEGKIQSVRQVEATRLWLMANSVFLPDLTKDTVTETLKQPLDPKVRRLLELRQALGKSSVSKYNAMLLGQSANGRMKGTMMYHGAGTGRFSGKRVQPHNFTRICFTEREYSAFIESTPDDFKDSGWDLITGASGALRGTLRAAPGNKLYCGDFSAIEARVLAWLTGEQWVLDAFNEGKDLYKVTAGTIYHTRYDDVSGAQRNVGKVADLALGYQGWIGAFRQFAKVYNVTFPEELRDKLMTAVERKASNIISAVEQCSNHTYTKKEIEKAQRILKAGPLDDDLFEEWAVPIMADWRTSHPETIKFWWGVEDAAVKAVKTGKTFSYRGIKFGMRKGFLHCRLRNGRILSYYDPKVKRGKDRYGRTKDQLSYMGINSFNNQWERIGTWGGKLTENIVQAMSRDFLTEAMDRVEEYGFRIVFHVHDEIVVELRQSDKKTFEKFIELMSVVPEWAKGCPTNVEGWEGVRYRKD